MIYLLLFSDVDLLVPVLMLLILQEQGLDYLNGRDGQFSNRSIGTPDARWIPQDSVKAYNELTYAGPKRHVILILFYLCSEGEIVIGFRRTK